MTVSVTYAGAVSQALLLVGKISLPMTAMGDRLKAARGATGLTQDEVARRCGITRNAVSRWESGTDIPKTKQLPVLAHVYQCSTDFLLGLVVAPKARYGSDKEKPIDKSLERLDDEELRLVNAYRILREIASDAASQLISNAAWLLAEARKNRPAGNVHALTRRSPKK